MSVLVIGGDKICNIKEKLKQSGFDKIAHITGRKKMDRKIKIPGKTDLVLVLIDYVGHNVTEVVKDESRKSDVRVMFSKRSWVHMEEAIQAFLKETMNVR